MSAQTMSEDQKIHLVRNALLAAGQEMGKGDQWPVIKDTVYKLMQDYEELKIERRVNAEMQKYYKEAIDHIEDNLPLCPDELKIQAIEMIKNLRELCQAHFEPVSHFETNFEELPIHAQRMINILSSLGDAND